ncbi:MAG: shikimate kinase [Acidobacteriota bacterium]|jgi:shikimate kinase|nr:shikimate kinase [Acidobacteriota bacterium]
MNTRAQAIIITGFMGAGKTTVAIALSRKLRCSMIDLDSFIAERMGRTAQVIIDEDGEQRFREIESQLLRDALENQDARIIALGGGTWTISDNRALINALGGFTVWLDAPFKVCWRRITNESRSRPLAREFDSTRELYDRRRAFYDEAMLRIEVSEDKSADAIAVEIIAALSREQEH